MSLPVPGPELRSREVRLGLVLYGGVSLAIYINGVTVEFFHAVRGRGLYRLIKALTDSDIVVDIVSGTSAGGINGIYLAYALCNHFEFTAFCDLWRESADIRRLLRSPSRGEDHCRSLLDSEGFYQPQLEAALAGMPAIDPHTPEDVSDFSEMDVFVTSTDLDGKVWTEFDDAGHAIEVKDHRAVFLLKHREGRKTPFDPSPDNRMALAKLARMTSCFPGAFTPVFVANVEPGEASVDARLQLWGQLEKAAYFVDGGVLDNKPFTHTLREIFYRTTNRDVERMLFYVEPDPEHFERHLEPVQPSILKATASSAVSIPGYESIADDLRMLAEHNRRLERYQGLSRDLLAELVREDQRKIRSWNELEPASLRTQYLNSRLGGIAERTIEGLLKTNGKAELMGPEKRRAASLLVKSFQGWRGDADETLEDFDVYYRLRRLFRIAYAIHAELFPGSSANPLDGGEGAAPTRAQRNLYQFLWTAINRQIELLDILRAAMERLVDDSPVSWMDIVSEDGDPAEIAARVWEQVQRLMRRLLDADGPARRGLPPAYPTRWSEAEAGLVAALASGESIDPQVWSALAERLPSQQELSAFCRVLQQSIDELVDEVAREKGKVAPAERSGAWTGLLAITDAYERRLFETLFPAEPKFAEEALAADPLCRIYQQFVYLDAHLFPLELASGLHEKDVIKTTRISPLDAQAGFSEKKLCDKLSGDAVHHFGGFLKRSWRSNDILWGRLDGLCELTECLLNESRVAQVLADPQSRRRVLRSFFGEEAPGPGASISTGNPLHPANLFPNAGAATQQDLREYLEELLLAGDAERPQYLGERFGYYRNLLIEAGQLEVLQRMVPRVIEDAIAEQAEWNQFRVPAAFQEQRGWSEAGLPGYDATQAVFRPGDAALDPLVVSAAAQEAARAAVARLENADNRNAGRPTETAVGAFFKAHYRVGSEELARDIPTPVLLEILSTALLVVRNIVLTLFGARAKTVQKKPAFVLLLDWPLRAFHTWTVWWRRSPAEERYRRLVLISLAVLALIVGLWWPEPVLHRGSQMNWPGILLFLALPLLILGPVALAVWRNRIGKLRGGEILEGIALVLFAGIAIGTTMALLMAWWAAADRVAQRYIIEPRGWDPDQVRWIFRWVALLLLVLVPVAARKLYAWFLRQGRARTAPADELIDALERLEQESLASIAERFGADAENARWANLSAEEREMLAERALRFAARVGRREDLAKELAVAAPAPPADDSREALCATLEQIPVAELRRLDRMFGMNLRQFLAPRLRPAERAALARQVVALARSADRLAELDAAIRAAQPEALQGCPDATLQHALASYFTSTQLRKLAGTFGVSEPAFLAEARPLSGAERSQLADALLAVARRQHQVPALEQEMRAASPGALC